MNGGMIQFILLISVAGNQEIVIVVTLAVSFSFQFASHFVISRFFSLDFQG